MYSVLGNCNERVHTKVGAMLKRILVCATRVKLQAYSRIVNYATAKLCIATIL